MNFNEGSQFVSFAKQVAITLAIVLTMSSAFAVDIPTVEQWDIFELDLDGPREGNPFVDVQLGAVFSNGHKQFEVEGFYDGEGAYKIRFMPDVEGEWRYQTSSNAWALTNKSGSFFVTPASEGNHGPVRVANTFHFAYADGTPFKQIGTTSYTWSHRPAKIEEQTLKTLANSPFNKLRMCVFPQTHGISSMPPTRFPFTGKSTQPDYSRFNTDFFRHLEMRVGQLRELGIEADLILFHPYDDEHIWGLDTMPAEVEARYLRYIVARLAAYRNVWWSMANEFDFVRTKTTADWDRYFQIVMQADPYDHLRSIHNGKEIYDHNKPWVTHVSMQNGFAVTSPGTAQLYRDVYNKPIVYDEVEYEGNHDARWAQLSAKELVHRFWSGTVVGTYVGHSEFVVEANDKHKVVWLGQGGVLRGESAARLAFLREILEAGPAQGIEPIDKWWNPNIGGRHGEYYLIYFGKQTPKQWTAKLPARGLEAGMRFKLELIDTWDMTISTLEENIEVVAQDRYFFADTGKRVFALPSRQGLALRLTRIH